jgi:hypothetical protein
VRCDDRVVQVADRRVEVVPDLLVGVGEALRQAHGQVATGDRAEPFRQQPHDPGLLLRDLDLGVDVSLALVLDLGPQHGELLRAVAFLGFLHRAQGRLGPVQGRQQPPELIPTRGRDLRGEVSGRDLL